MVAKTTLNIKDFKFNAYVDYITISTHKINGTFPIAGTQLPAQITYIVTETDVGPIS